jgi:hypothetical protein
MNDSWKTWKTWLEAHDIQWICADFWVPQKYVDALGLDVVRKIVEEDCGKDYEKAISMLDRYVALRAFA